MGNSDTNYGLGNTVYLIDITLTIITFLLSMWIRNVMQVDEVVDLYSHIFLIPLTIFLIISFLSYFGGYNEPRSTTMVGYSWAISRSLIVTVAILLSLLFFLKIQYVSRFVVLAFAIGEFFVLLLVRAAVVYRYKEAIKSGTRTLKVLVVGTRTRALELVSALRQQVIWGVDVVGMVDPDPSLMGAAIQDIPVIGTVENIHQCLKENVIDEVIIAIPRTLLEDAEPIVMACEEEGIRLRFMADIFNVQIANISLTQVQDIPLLTMEPVSQDGPQLLAKRVMDLTLTIVCLPLLIPLFAIIAIAIKIDSPGPIFFTQERVGLRKRRFLMYKFRSMHKGAEGQLEDLEHLNEAEGPIFKMVDDPRVTKLGALLRKSSLDELPQLINVLKGEMSLVGPRPMSVRDVNLFNRGIQRKRFSVQPGMTCIWQISGRSDLPFSKWLEFDLEYIDNWSFFLDLKILLKTFPAVFKFKGAV